MARDVARQECAARMTTVDLREDRAARRARKLAIAMLVEFAAIAGTLVTREGPVQYAQGDALLTGTEGERWPVPRQRFDATYEPVAPLRPGKPGTYRKRPQVVWAKSMHQTFAVELDGGRGTLQGSAGDWLLQYAPGDLSVVSASVFAKTYELLD
jgi:PGDYG protein